jgi:hypothetical protein
VLGNVSGVTGFDFETSIRDCWHNPETSVFVSKAGGGKKTVLFSYYSPDAPTITAIDDRTIQVTLGDIDHVFCRTDKWEGLTIKYVIRSIRYPGRDEPRECERLFLLDLMQRMAIFLDLMLRLAAAGL